MSRLRTNRVSTAVRLLALAGVLLVAFSGFAQAVHVHTDNTKLPSHECSLCSFAHSGAIASVAYQPSPMFTLTELFIAPERVQQSAGFVFSLRIRPPPTV